MHSLFRKKTNDWCTKQSKRLQNTCTNNMCMYTDLGITTFSHLIYSTLFWLFNFFWFHLLYTPHATYFYCSTPYSVWTQRHHHYFIKSYYKRNEACSTMRLIVFLTCYFQFSFDSRIVVFVLAHVYVFKKVTICDGSHSNSSRNR